MKKLMAAGLVLFASVVSAGSDLNYVGVHVTVPLTFDAVGVQAVGRYQHGELRAGVDSRGIYQAGAGLTTGEDLVPSFGAAYSSHHKTVVPYGAVAYGTGEAEVGGVDYGFDDLETMYLYAGWRAGRSNDSSNDKRPVAPASDKRVTAPESPVVSTKPDSPNDGAPDWSDIGGGNEHGQGGNSGGGDSGNNGGSNGNGNGNNGNGNGNGGPSGENPGNGQGPTGENPGTGGGSNQGGGNSGNNGSGGNRSGLGDGTNPGKGSGRDNSPNTGKDNPNNARR